MFTFDLNSKLKSLNKGLYIDVNVLTQMSRGETTLAIKKHSNKRVDAVAQDLLAQANQEDRLYIDSKVHGTVDEFICAIPYPYVPEYDEFYLDTGFMKKRGWRSVAMYLVKRNICSIDQAKKAFQCSSLGEDDWDRLSYDGKLRKVRRTK